MAASPFDAPNNTSCSAFGIFRDAAGATESTPPPPSPHLPGGPCNFIDLAHGSNGVKCGCRRFWGRQTTGSGRHVTDQVGWCMCSHHACFHDHVQTVADGPQSSAALDSVQMVQPNEPGQEKERPRSNRTPMSPMQVFHPDYVPNSLPNSLKFATIDFTTSDYDAITTNVGLDMHIPQDRPQSPPTDGASMPDTLSWTNVASTQGGHTPLPNSPSHSLTPHSPSASTTASSQMRYSRPFGGKGLNTLSTVPRNKNGSVTEAEEPAAANQGHAPDDAVAVGSGAASPPPGPSQAMGPPPPPLSAVSAGSGNGALHHLTDTVEDHEIRIDKLETGSIYAAAHEECSDKHDITDLRVMDLESRVNEVEKQIANDDASVSSSSRTTQRDNDASLHATLTSQLETLQARVNHLERSSSPSYSTPWKLEVVFLPFPLTGIWQEAEEFKAPRISGERHERTQLPSINTNARATPEPRTRAGNDEWIGLGSDWLLPRAFVPGRTIDQRLRSRGLIKTVSLRAGDARSVQVAVGSAFESVLRLIPSLTSPRSPYAPDSRVDRFLGLQHPWVPLRKVHKDARLRFLSPAELLTPVLWNATFLMDSVVMKASGVHRLYITQPEAYLQDSHLFNLQGAEPSPWTWQRLREFARVYPESQSSQTGDSEVPEADALEAHWAYHPRLDEPPSARQSSLHSLQERAVTISKTSSDVSIEQFFTGPTSPVVSMMSPVRMRAQSPLVPRDRIGSYPPPSFRAGSVPLLSSPIMSSPRHTRRVSSFAVISPALARPSYQRHSSPLISHRASPRLTTTGAHPAPLSPIAKHHHRRRSTRSPSVRGLRNNTPRWSNRSYSRSPSAISFLHPVYAEDTVRGERRVTPFAYATPHSNAPLEHPPHPHALRVHGGGGGGGRRHMSRSGDVFEDEDENMIEGFDGDDNGSSTESEEDDPDIDVYEDQNDMLDDLESDDDNQHQHNHPQALQPLSSSLPQGGGDDVLPGIEDNSMVGEEHFAHAEEKEEDDDDDDVDNLSDVSSMPSEYPSRQPEPMGDGREMTHGPEAEDAGVAGFLWHGGEDGEDQEDEEEEEEDDGDNGQEPW